MKLDKTNLTILVGIIVVLIILLSNNLMAIPLQALIFLV